MKKNNLLPALAFFFAIVAGLTSVTAESVHTIAVDANGGTCGRTGTCGNAIGSLCSEALYQTIISSCVEPTTHERYIAD